MGFHGKVGLLLDCYSSVLWEFGGFSKVNNHKIGDKRWQVQRNKKANITLHLPRNLKLWHDPPSYLSDAWEFENYPGKAALISEKWKTK